MNELKIKALKGTVFLTLSTIFSNIFIFLERIVLTRSLNPEQFGIFSLALSIVNFTLFLIYFGITTGILRFLPYYVSKNMKDLENGIKRFSYFYGYLMGFLGTFFIIISSHFLTKFYNEKGLFYALLIFSPSIFFIFFSDVVSTVFLGYSITKFKALFRNIFFPFLRLVFFIIAFLYYRNNNLYIYISLYTLSSFLIFLISFYKKPKTFPPYKYEIKEILRFSLPIAIIGFYGLLMGKIDTMMIGKYLEIENVGFYSIAFSLAILVKIFFNSSSEPYVPLATKLVEKNKITELENLLLSVNKINIIMTFIIMIIGLYAGPVLIPKIFGIDYIPSIIPFKILAFGFFLQSFFGLFAPTFTSIGDTRPLLFMSVSSGLLNIILNFFLIRKFGMIGAGLATIISEIVFSSWGVIYLKHKYRISGIKKETSILAFLFSIIGLFFLINNLYIFKTIFLFLIIIFFGFYIKNLINDYKITKSSIET